MLFGMSFKGGFHSAKISGHLHFLKDLKVTCSFCGKDGSDICPFDLLTLHQVLIPCAATGEGWILGLQRRMHRPQEEGEKCNIF